ncbi:class I SAM-dependent methyltransferase [Parahaliea maris]|uniref:Class I SAM-dependent methyltransferase n=1 Tax=Parahaliea maris TaxID=2716870 RepID=A0A5C9A7H4_9GAMM|nr:class I SAM-dependent methyltransferase [Parahaliea maris]TXS96688.1 class I SAM-dependent methyltransferase [Parahaliea maris]
MNCRFCHSPELSLVVDLGYSPPSNAYLESKDLVRPEIWYPLRVRVCNECWLVQTEDYADCDQLFSDDYAYFSSTSQSWLQHAKKYQEHITDRLSLNNDSFVVELASNDGYLLQYFVAANIPCLGIEPTRAAAEQAEEKGIPVLREFFGHQLGIGLAKKKGLADLVIGNNVYAHVPDINDFTAGIKAILSADGVITLEFPHVLEMLQQNQFDTIYHEHFSYLSLYAVKNIFSKHGLRVWDVESLPTHGGSLRIYGCHQDSSRATKGTVRQLLEKESAFGINSQEIYTEFGERVVELKNNFLRFLLDCKLRGLKICGYGAAAKGNTLMNFAGIRPDMIKFVCDAAPSKQGKYLPGSHIPVIAPDAIRDEKPDVVIVLPWNLIEEIKESLFHIKEWDGRLAVALPDVKFLPL